MKQLRKPRFWLFTTAALIFGSHMSASAQIPNNYHSGAPTMVAAAPSLPTISPDQIARDVRAEFNPRTGQTELVAAPFDPFEDDPNLAGSLRLRSASGATGIDGRPLRNGALVEVDFYYNSPSDDPYGGRNYSDASFVNGEYAPVVLRDTRILECSTRVNNVVYNHNEYYSPSFSNIGIYQPYRHYTGHSGFGFGFGSSYFGPGYSSLDISRFRRSQSRNSFLPRITTPNAGRRIVGAIRGGRRNGLIGRAVGADPRTETPPPTVAPPILASTPPTNLEIQRRVGGLRATATDLRNGGRLGPRRSITAEPRIVVGNGPTPPQANTQASTPARVQTRARSGAASRVRVRDGAASRVRARDSDSVSERRALRRGQTQNAASRQNNPKQNAPKRSIPKQSAPKQSAPKRSIPKQSAPKQSRSSQKRSETKSRSSSKRSNNSSRSSSKSTRRNAASSIRGRLNFYPTDAYGGRHVVTSRSVDCAREDKLSVFIPYERLDAARFDGLTLVALDAQGGETPIYIPPNYIQGYRLAETGRVQPQGYSSAPQQAPIQPFQSQRPNIQAAPCPAGTLKQPDGTCLQNSVTGYPTR